ncbi:MAG: adenosylcobinamide-phosphate synthase CbiB [Thermodesulfobacteriota bacterium]|nr:adenosylcobinamide-phosphate synthase CbiB [Thermodesulfobacteriota bacterium]
MLELALILFLAFIFDLLLGDPRYRFHPIRLIGRCIALFTRILRRVGLDGRWGGIVLVVIVEFVFLIAFLAPSLVLHRIHILLGLGFDLFICYSCLALKDLFYHMDRVNHALGGGNLAEARKGIAMVVGRDVRFLDEKGISRAAIETMAENFVDGFLSPLFWYLNGGILGYILGLSPVMTAAGFMVTFKVASTLDSMVGYKDSEFLEFGWAGAKLDDIMNFIPARLSLIVLFAGAWICGLKASEGIRVALRDRLKHDSPNAAHAESFVAGSLEVRLGGPTVYPDGQKDKPWLGEGNPDPLPQHIQRTASLLTRSAWVAVGCSICALVLLA